MIIMDKSAPVPGTVAGTGKWRAAPRRLGTDRRGGGVPAVCPKPRATVLLPRKPKMAAAAGSEAPDSPPSTSTLGTLTASGLAAINASTSLTIANW